MSFLYYYQNDPWWLWLGLKDWRNMIERVIDMSRYCSKACGVNIGNEFMQLHRCLCGRCRRSAFWERDGQMWKTLDMYQFPVSGCSKSANRHCLVYKTRILRTKLIAQACATICGHTHVTARSRAPVFTRTMDFIFTNICQSVKTYNYVRAFSVQMVVLSRMSVIAANINPLFFWRSQL